MIRRWLADWRRGRQVIAQTEDPRGQLEQLRTVTADCLWPGCLDHWQEWRDMENLLAILGEAPTAPDPAKKY